MKILLIEDEETLNKVIAKRLRVENMIVDTCWNGEEALDMLRVSSYDLVIADIMIPYLDGISVLKQVRAEGNRVPFLVLTARDNLQDKLESFSSGADDYLVKPFDFEELIARVHAIIRRSVQGGDDILKVGPLSIDVKARAVHLNGEKINLSTKEFDLLYYLVSNKNIVLSRQQILDHVWEYDYESYSNLIDVYIKDLRKKIDTSPHEKLIHTVRGVGYVFRVED